MNRRGQYASLFAAAPLYKRNNQEFVQIPFNTLISIIIYKAEESEIQTIVIDEAYTGKASFRDKETIEHHHNYAGMIISKGIIINADANAAYNMISKAIPE